MKKLEWHISKFGFCNGISPTYENCNGIDPINPNSIARQFSKNEAKKINKLTNIDKTISYRLVITLQRR